jgi:MFS family permease
VTSGLTASGLHPATRRNTILLAATLTCLSGMVQLVVAVATLTLVLVTGIESILGLGPAIFLVAAAAAAFPGGRAMDQFGRVPVLAVGCLAGVAGCAVSALGCAVASAALVIVGFALVGASQGVVLLARAAAADLYPPSHRARGISYVLLGALFGAATGPLVFRPLLAGKDLELDALVVPYLAAGAIMAVGVGLVLAIRPDPKRIAEQLGGEHNRLAPARPLGELIRGPGVVPALASAVASFAVMVGVMNLTGYIVVGHGHHQADVFTVISAHIVGMYALVLVIGGLIDRAGRRPALAGGLALEAVSVLSLAWFDSVPLTSLALFGLGLGWNVSYVAAATELSDAATASERGRLIGLTDLLSATAAAALALLGGAVYSAAGVAPLAVGVTLLALVPALLVALGRTRPEAAAQATG